MKKLFVIIFSILNFFLVAQPKKNLQFLHLSIEQGLSSSDALEIVQDKQGFIWVATEDGLNRFDSYNFKVYKKITNDTTSLIYNFVSTIFVDSEGTLWAGTHRGISVYDRDYDSFINFRPDSDPSSNQSNHIISFAENKSHQLYVGLQDGQIFSFNRENKTFKKVKGLNKAINFLYFDSDDQMWVLSDSIYIYNNKMDLIKAIKNPAVKYPYKCMIEDKDKYWIGTSGSGIFWYDKKTKSLLKSLQNGIYENYTNVFYKDNENNIWVGSSNSLKMYDRKNDIFYYYYSDEKNKYSLSSSGVRSFFQDNEGNYWALTAKGGLNVSLARKNFINLTPDPENKIAPTKKTISSIVFDIEDRLWAGSFHAGLDLIDFNNDTVYHFDHNPLKKESLGAGSVLMLFEDSKNNIWVGSYRGGLQLYDKKRRTFISYKHDPNTKNSISSEDVRSMIEDNEGNFWLATCGNGLDKFNPQTNSFLNYRQDLNNAKTWLVNNWLYAILYDHQENIWIGSSFGLSMLAKDRKTFTNYFNNPNDSNSLSNNYINYLFEDSKKKLWVGTNEGLNLFDRESKTFKIFLQREGLPNNVIKGILEDEHGNLWISTNRGISKFDTKNLTFRNYDIADGLASNEFNQGACAKNKNGQLLFGSNNGILCFFPDSIHDNPNVPPVYIVGFKIFNKPVFVGQPNSPLKKDISQTSELTLHYNQASFISFEFVSVSYTLSEKKQYAYMMDGFDETWVYCGTKREATYTNLDPGNYVFKVKVCNNDGIWSENGTSIKITILPPWWETNLARVSYIIVIIILLLGFYYYRMNQFKNQKKILEKLVTERTNELNIKANQLLDANTRLEEQAEEIKISSENIKEANKLLLEKQNVILEQSAQLKENNRELSLLNTTKDQFFSIIAHDLKNPFNSILGFSDILSKRYSNLDDNKRAELIDAINQSSRRLFKLLENLLQWARTQTGKIKYEPEEIVLNELIDLNISLVENLVIEKNLVLKRNFDNQIKIFADKNMIDTVIRNLISNAIKFTRDGSISIEAFQENEKTIVNIIDTGVGIDSNKLEKIFEVMRLKSTKGTNGETGTGLGLILCKEFIKKHGGIISAKSQPGQGSVFSFTIPHKQPKKITLPTL